jgi:hypothetical protein
MQSKISALGLKVIRQSAAPFSDEFSVGVRAETGNEPLAAADSAI